MAVTISTVFNKPSVLKDNLIKIVVIINPEFLITLLNLSEYNRFIQRQRFYK